MLGAKDKEVVAQLAAEWEAQQAALELIAYGLWGDHTNEEIVLQLRGAALDVLAAQALDVAPTPSEEPNDS
jgi:hypothetical protein